MTQVNLYDFKAKLSEYSRRVKQGETIVICDRHKPFAELRPLPPEPIKNRRLLGQLKGVCRVPQNFHQADPAIEKLFEGK